MGHRRRVPSGEGLRPAAREARYGAGDANRGEDDPALSGVNSSATKVVTYKLGSGRIDRARKVATMSRDDLGGIRDRARIIFEVCRHRVFDVRALGDGRARACTRLWYAARDVLGGANDPGASPRVDSSATRVVKLGSGCIIRARKVAPMSCDKLGMIPDRLRVIFEAHCHHGQLPQPRFRLRSWKKVGHRSSPSESRIRRGGRSGGHPRLCINRVRKVATV